MAEVCTDHKLIQEACARREDDQDKILDDHEERIRTIEEWKGAMSEFCAAVRTLTWWVKSVSLLIGTGLIGFAGWMLQQALTGHFIK